MPKIIWHRWSPQTLQTFALQAVSQLLVRLNDLKIGSDFLWLRHDCNPFEAIPNNIIEDILEDLKNSLLVSHKTVCKELIQIMHNKRMKKFILNHFLIREDDISNILRMIESVKESLVSFGVPTRNEKGKAIIWKNNPTAYSFLFESLASMSSLTHLNVSGVCNDVMLGVIGDCCPNLVSLVAISEDITGRGLKSLCEPRGNEHSKRCGKLQKIRLFSRKKNEELLSGIESLLVHVPSLRMLECSPLDIGKILLKVHNQENSLKFNLREWTYDGSFENPFLPSVLVRTCPFLTSLKIWNTSNQELQQFECIDTLKNVIIKKDGLWVNFTDGVVPFLEKTGRNLESLTLLFFDNIDYKTIDQCCGDLKRLYCCSFSALSGKATSTPLFRNLEYLSLTSGVRSGMKPLDCVCLLSYCVNLQYLVLNCCESLGKRHLKQIISMNPLSNLQCAHIDSANLSIQGTLSDLKTFTDL